MLQERGVVGTAAQVADRNVAFRLARREGGACLQSPRWETASTAPRAARLLPGFVDGATLGAGNGFGHVAHKLFETGNGRRAELRAGDGDVHIEVGGRIRQFCFVLFDPFGRAHQAFFFAVPTAEDQCALRLPAGLQQFADAVHGFEHGRGAAVGIDCAVDPGVAMIARDHPFVGQFAAAHAADRHPRACGTGSPA